MRGDDELGKLLRQIVQSHEHRQLTLGRKRGFRFVEKVDPMPAQPLREQIEKRFSVRLRVQALAAVAREHSASERRRLQLVQLRRPVVEALRAEKKSIRWAIVRACDP